MTTSSTPRGIRQRHATCEKCASKAMCSRIGCADKWPASGSRWTSTNWPSGSVAVVLGVVQGWVVWRRKGAAPQLRHVNQWHDAFLAVEAPKRKPSAQGVAGEAA